MRETRLLRRIDFVLEPALRNLGFERERLGLYGSQRDGGFTWHLGLPTRHAASSHGPVIEILPTVGVGHVELAKVVHAGQPTIPVDSAAVAYVMGYLGVEPTTIAYVFAVDADPDPVANQLLRDLMDRAVEFWRRHVTPAELITSVWEYAFREQLAMWLPPALARWESADRAWATVAGALGWFAPVRPAGRRILVPYWERLVSLGHLPPLRPAGVGEATNRETLPLGLSPQHLIGWWREHVDRTARGDFVSYGEFMAGLGLRDLLSEVTGSAAVPPVELDGLDADFWNATVAGPSVDLDESAAWWWTRLPRARSDRLKFSLARRDMDGSPDAAETRA